LLVWGRPSVLGVGESIAGFSLSLPWCSDSVTSVILLVGRSVGWAGF
jgi:hypothetical protein